MIELKGHQRVSRIILEFHCRLVDSVRDLSHFHTKKENNKRRTNITRRHERNKKRRRAKQKKDEDIDEQ